MYGEEDQDDPAEDAKPSGRGYPDTRPYVKHNEKKYTHRMKKGNEVPEYFDEDDDEYIEKGESDIDATDFLMELNDKVDSLQKGLAIIGELVAEVADPKMATMQLRMAKALAVVTTKIGTIEKALTESATLQKAAEQTPGTPKIAGINFAQAGGDTMAKSDLSEDDRNKLFKARMGKEISANEYRDALQSRDTTILSKAAGGNA